MAALKPIVLSLALVSTASMALAGHFNSAVPNRIPSCFPQSVTLNRFLNGNSYAGRVRHHYLKGDHGLWLAGFGQLTGGYNSAYLLTRHGRYSHDSLQNYTPAGTFTVALPHVDAMAGYDSKHIGFFVEYGYSRMPDYDGTTVRLDSGLLSAREAYMTYKLNSNLAVKAGHFITDFGRFDVTNPLMSAVDDTDLHVMGATQGATGVEGVVSAGGWHGSIAGMEQPNATTVVSGHITNNAKPNSAIVTGGYNTHLGSGILGYDLSYTNRTAVITGILASAFTGDVHYTNNRWQTTAQFFHENRALSNGSHVWMFSGDAAYRFSTRFSAGGYGDYVAGTNNTTFAQKLGTHWIIGAKAGYALTRTTMLNAYLQHQTVVQSIKDLGGKSNTSGILALTVKV